MDAGVRLTVVLHSRLINHANTVLQLRDTVLAFNR